MKRWHYWIVIYCTLASVLTLERYLNYDRHHYRDREEYHALILAAQTERPVNIRVLQPLVVEALAGPRDGPWRRVRFEAGYCAFRWISLLVLFIAFESWLLRFCDIHAARLVVLLVAGVLPLSFYGYYYQPTGLIDTGALALGLLLTARGWFWPMIPLVIVATMNRNTAVFIVGAWFLWHLPGKTSNRRALVRLFVQSAVLGACWLGVIVVLEHLYPSDVWVALPPEYIRYNLASKRGWLLGAVMFLPLIVALPYGWRTVPRQARWLALLTVPYVLLHFCMGHLDKVRYWINLYLLLGPFLVASYRRYAPVEPAASSP